MVPVQTALIVTLILLATTILPAQPLYLLRGAIRASRTQEPWRNQVLRLDEEARKLTVVRELDDTKFGGVGYSLVNHEHRIVVLGMPADGTNKFMVLDMNDLENPYLLQPSLDAPLAVAWLPLGSRSKPVAPPLGVRARQATLLFHPDFGLMLSLDLFGPEGEADYVIPVGQSQLKPLGRSPLPSDWSGFISSGMIGIGYTVQYAEMGVEPFEDHLRVLRRPTELGVEGDITINLSMPAPPSLKLAGAACRPLALVTNSSRFLTLICRRAADNSVTHEAGSLLYVYDKIAAKWQVVPVPGDSPFVRAIGKYLLGSARSQRRSSRRSAGLSEYETLASSTAPEFHPFWLAPHGEAYYPGILFAIDVATGRRFQWRTNQADSEILWADDSVFYYRRLNELFKVKVIRGADGAKLGSPVSILKADVLLDVHVAFRGK